MTLNLFLLWFTFNHKISRTILCTVTFLLMYCRIISPLRNPGSTDFGSVSFGPFFKIRSSNIHWFTLTLPLYPQTPLSKSVREDVCNWLKIPESSYRYWTFKKKNFLTERVIILRINGLHVNKKYWKCGNLLH